MHAGDKAHAFSRMVEGMSKSWFWILPLMAACGSSNDQGGAAADAGDTDAGAAFDAAAIDASAPDDAGADVVSVDADAGGDADASDAATCTTKDLLVGGTDVTAQGWTVVKQDPATVSNGADYVKLETSTNGGATTSGMLLLTKANAFEVGKPFKVSVEMMVESVSTHNKYDSAAAILGSFTPPFGVSADRDQMIYLDGAAIGWADDSQSFAATVTNGAYHTYVLSVDAAGVATVTVDGAAALTRNAFVTNGTLAIGDQTNDKDVDAVVRIRSVKKLCP